jgi:hypothetical protein
MSMTINISRRVERCALAPLLLGVLCIVGDRIKGADNATTLTPTEARILVYLSPVGEEERGVGLDIAMEAQSSPHLNQADYYYFWVYNAKRELANGSVTIGYYAVNKHTADVWDTDEKRKLSSKPLLGVQKIVRESHHIDEGTMEKYRSRPF